MALYDPQELARMFAENPKSIELTNEFKEGSVEWKRRNLENLMRFLYDLPDDYEKFNMKSWIEPKEGRRLRLEPATVVGNLCGTSACAAGHAAVLGIGNPERFNDWDLYTAHAFGDEAGLAGLWMADWQDYYPTPRHAALRIAHYLKYDEEITEAVMAKICDKTLEEI